MKTFKKALSIVLCLALMLSCVAGMQVTASAEGEEATTPALVLSAINSTYDLYAPEKEGLVGVHVNVGANAGFAALGYEVTYDDALALHYVVKDGKDMTDYPIEEENQAESSENLTDKPYKMQWAFTGNQTAENFTLAYLEFALPADVTAGTQYNVTFTVKEAWDENGNAVAVTESFSATITVVDNTPTEEPEECAHENKTVTEEVTLEATCTEAGSKVVTTTCDACGEVISTETVVIEATGEHSFGDWVVTKEATKDAHGSKTRTCSVCSTVETDVIPRIFRLSGVNLEFANNIAIMFMPKADYFGDTEVGGFSDPYIVYTMNGEEEITLTEYTVANDGRPVFSISMTPQCMMDTISIRTFATFNGEVVEGESLEYYAAKYCYSRLKNSNDAKFKKLIVNLLNYGTKAQLYKGRNVENLANAELTEEQAAFGTTGTREYHDVQNTAYSTIDNPTATWKAVNLSLASAVEITFGAVLPADISNIKLVATNGKTTWEVPSSEFVYNSSKSRYDFGFAELAAHQMDDIILFTIYDGDTPISNTFSYSVETYAGKKGVTSADSKLAEVFVAMMNYGDAANDYAG